MDRIERMCEVYHSKAINEDEDVKVEEMEVRGGGEEGKMEEEEYENNLE